MIVTGAASTSRLSILTSTISFPRARVAQTTRANLQLLCGNCNSRKGTGSMSQLMVKLLKERGIR